MDFEKIVRAFGEGIEKARQEAEGSKRPNVEMSGSGKSMSEAIANLKSIAGVTNIAGAVLAGDKNKANKYLENLDTPEVHELRRLFASCVAMCDTWIAENDVRDPSFGKKVDEGHKYISVSKTELTTLSEEDSTVYAVRFHPRTKRGDHDVNILTTPSVEFVLERLRHIVTQCNAEAVRVLNEWKTTIAATERSEDPGDLPIYTSSMGADLAHEHKVGETSSNCAKCRMLTDLSAKED